jgi:superoxide dismutase, Fe-Mn family
VIERCDEGFEHSKTLEAAMPYTVPDLPYPYDALEPHIDAQTMQIHHDKHHQAYVDKVNAALSGTDWDGKPIEDVLKSLDSLPADKQKAVRNNGGGHYNHSLFWEWLSPNGGGAPDGALAAAIDAAFGSFADFQAKFKDAGVNQFGSGWAWLVHDGSGLAVTSTPNQDNPISAGQTPLLGADVWEHAYYLKYQNRRPDYLDAFWNVVNWAKVAELFGAAS